MKKKLKKIFRLSIPLIILIIAAFFVYRNYAVKKNKAEYTTAKITKQTLVQTVGETGAVKPSEEISLSFLSSGRIMKKNIKTGDKVKKDQILAELDLRDANIRLKQSQAALAGAHANLSKVLQGASAEDLRLSETGINQAQSTYDTSKNELEKLKASLNEAVKQAEKNYSDLNDSSQNNLTPSEQAVFIAQSSLETTESTYKQARENSLETLARTSQDKMILGYTAMDEVRKILDDSDARDLLGAKNTYYLSVTKSGYDNAKSAYNISKQASARTDASGSIADIKEFAKKNQIFLNETLNLLNNCFKLLENSITDTNFTLTDLSGYKTTISTQLTYINAALTAQQSAIQGYDSAVLNYDTKTADAKENLEQAKANYQNSLLAAKNAVETAKKNRSQQISLYESKVASAKQSIDYAKAQYDKTGATARSSDIAYAQSQVRQAEAGVLSAQKAVDDAIIKAPMDGVITDVKQEVGELGGPSAPTVIMLGKDSLEIDVDISETDIDKIAVGNPAQMTFDAFSEDVKLKGEVFFIDPAQTVIQEVIYYRVKISIFDAEKQAEKKASDAITKIKPGMSANVTIETARQEDALAIPVRAVIDKGADGKFTRILKDNAPAEIPIVTGLEGDEGLVELISGLSEGSDVITFVKENK